MRVFNMSTFISLFRGINVGGNHRVKMNDLKTIYEALGLTDVQTYIQSGNVVFKSPELDITHVQQHLIESVAQTFGFRVEIIMRTVAEFQEIIAKNPFQGRHEKAAHWIAVMFLSAPPEQAAQEKLLKTYVGPEEIFFLGKEVYIYYTDGMGRSKLSNNFIEKKLKVDGTTRNWNTILQLQEMALR
jgi:uncharacterized protein (DUF1697 family)